MGRPRKKIDDRLLLKMYVIDGMSTREIAKVMGIGKSTVHKRLKELGVRIEKKVVIEKSL